MRGRKCVISRYSGREIIEFVKNKIRCPQTRVLVSTLMFLYLSANFSDETGATGINPLILSGEEVRKGRDTPPLIDGLTITIGDVTDSWERTSERKVTGSLTVPFDFP